MWIPAKTMFFSCFYPFGKAGGFQLPVFDGIFDPRCQGIAVNYYGVTLGALLERSVNPACGGSEPLRLFQRWGLGSIPEMEIKRRAFQTFFSVLRRSPPRLVFLPVSSAALRETFFFLGTLALLFSIQPLDISLNFNCSVNLDITRIFGDNGKRSEENPRHPTSTAYTIFFDENGIHIIKYVLHHYLIDQLS